MADPAHDAALAAIWSAAGGSADWLACLQASGAGGLPSVFSTTSLASAAVGAACLAVAELAHGRDGVVRNAAVDRRLASLWFGRSIRPDGWSLAPSWDAIAGDYRARDGWIKLHTNAPHHRAAALAVLAMAAERGEVARAVAGWDAAALESAVLERGGCAAAMRSLADWAEHPQGRALAGEPLLHRESGAPGAGHRIGPADRPLRGVRVLDLTRVLAGPVATRFLAGFGAEVLRIDPPDWNEPGLVPDVTLGKRCARLDLRLPSDRAQLEALIAAADVLVHGYRPDALARLGLDAQRRQALRPGLVDVSLDAYGWSGPWAGRRGFDSLVQMSSGIADAGMRAAGVDRPVSLPVQALDHATGYIMAAAAVRGLLRREAQGTGSILRASLARTAALLVGLPGHDPHALAAENAEDYAAAVEATPWGPARRLKPPCGIDGIAIDWDRPASELGSASAAWVA